MTYAYGLPKWRQRSRYALLAAAAIASSVVASSAIAQQAGAGVVVPTVTGPFASEGLDSPSNDYIFFSTDIALESRGYREEEYFVSGVGNTYDAPDRTPDTLPTENARVVETGIPYHTRMVVRRPVDPADFNGTVVVEWLNVSDGFDGEYFWVQSHQHLLRDGYVYVGLSAQDNSISHEELGLKKFSAERYGKLDVTGGSDECCLDSQTAYDIFAQVGTALKNNGEILGGLDVKNLIGVGMSQSGRRMSVYANYLHLGAPIYDGFLFQVHNSPLRDDLKVPAIRVLSESEYDDVFEESETELRKSYWVSGSSHGDILQRVGRNGVRLRDLGIGLTGNDACGPTGPLGESLTRTRTPISHVINAAVHHLKANIENGTPLPSGPIPKWAPAEQWVERDERGNAMGGIQLADMAVPTARSDGLECGNIGVWEPFPTETLTQLYPTHEAYVEKVRAAVEANIDAGFVLPEDGQQTIAEANASVIGTGLECGTYCLDRSHYRLDFSSTGVLRLSTDYYNIVDGEELVAAIDAAHRNVAEGDTAEAPQNAQFHALAVHHLREYLDLLKQAREDGRVTDTASDVLSMQAYAIIKGLQR
ncbi:alpha/beta hydrolase domain-containing protein [Devosia sp. 919]|uniref:alpha/beta hydrolase domain-containing protein n=1 Tax=Devosia sp. 919 TaxID=2726065 RepID=UPI001557E2FA|nr:alpha/beta hydrolase domain-containing protein [Devosia sp. 919]